ncbi:GTPase/DUF3482 domain-containing protein [Alteromonas sp. ASW11-36]|uniref:GTPase/DUF3482 domain-containing protein n=1 Tax=Alteromonas arenosi TaxID=3055817 RepID=A0ABT7SZH9_9ALTE|nr:GTPase/DUF3482 domain-containing protein [Alteromonas sp. ASW11-36]MDM7861594.1 GTPase/DUF3482 domain-containing protein [Alteromonas sp. ASW11-36]
MSAKNIPRFAVVGHPNKGKSSIVSTLSRNDNIAISSRSGTTETAHSYLVETLHGSYALIDTPGFQRPRKVLQWLQKHCNSASERAATIKRFIASDECQHMYKDEVELLRPIAAGAAILYVVDGSHPYGSEYEAEMEILRWTGQPSMALINPIHSTDCIPEWENALAQFFKSVRVFNPLAAEFHKHTELLATFAHLNPQWSANIETIINDLKLARQAQQHESIKVLVELLEELCAHQHTQRVLNKQQAEAVKPMLEKQFKQWVKNREEQASAALLQIYAHQQTQVSLDKMQLPPELFDIDEWYIWGLDKKQLTYAATIAGAVSGAALDVAVAGHSFMLGAFGGGVIGASSAWFGSSKLLEMKLKGLPIGGYQATVGPIKNRNFPYVVMGRFIHLYRQVANLNHANRSALNINAEDFKQRVEQLEKSDQRELHKACERLLKQKSVDDLAATLAPLFELDEPSS